MTEKSKHRIIGTTVWVAVIVVFIPAIFDGAGYRALTAADMDFSGEPDIQIERHEPTIRNSFKATHEKLDLKELDGDQDAQSGADKEASSSQQPAARRSLSDQAGSKVPAPTASRADPVRSPAPTPVSYTHLTLPTKA